MMSYFWNVLASHDSFDLLSLLALAAAKATVLLAFAALLCVALRRLSAASRHLLWATALCASLLLPLLSFIEGWEVPILPARLSVLSSVSSSPGATKVTGSDGAFETRDAQASASLPRSSGAGAELSKASESQTKATSRAEFLSNTPAPLTLPQDTPSSQHTPPPLEMATPLLPSLLNTALAVWVVGVLLLLLKLLAGFVATNLLTRRATGFKDTTLTELFSSLLNELNFKGRVRLLRSERTSMPIVYGILRPAVLLPAEAERWSEERRRMVLLHELSHITRRDCLTQMLAQIACAFYWFNPFVWIAARRLRVEREEACDDYVLSIGAKPSDYASHLLEIARSMQERSVFEWSQTTSVAMARRSQLEGRLLAILSQKSARGAMPRATSLGFVALICALLSLAAIRPAVMHAHHPRTFNADSSDNGSDPRRDFPASPTAAAAEARGGAAAEPDATARVSGVQDLDAVAPVGSPQAQALNDARVEREAGRSLAGEVERLAGEEVAEAVAEPTAPPARTPEDKPLPVQEPNHFINAGYGQDRNSQTQAGRGDFIDEMNSAGYPNLSVDELIRLKTAGVNAAYVRSLRALGLNNLTPKELASMSIHRVTPAYIEAVRAAGYNTLSAKELTSFRIHGIAPEYVRTLREAGYGNLTAKQLIEFAIHRVTPAFIGEIRATGYGSLSPKELVSLRIYNITPEFIRKARSRLGDLTVRQLISLKNMGILEEDKGKDKAKG